MSGAINIEWRGQTYIVPDDRVVSMIAEIEEHVTLVELATKAEKGRPLFARVALGYAAALRFAGAKVTDREVYNSLFNNGAGPGNIVELTRGLLMIMAPPDSIIKASAEGNVEPESRGDTKSSKPRTKRS